MGGHLAELSRDAVSRGGITLHAHPSLSINREQKRVRFFRKFHRQFFFERLFCAGMQLTGRIFLTGLSRPRKFWAFTLLIIYVFLASPLAPLAAALFALSDPGHQVLLECNAQGPALVLHHQNNFEWHQHGKVAKALVLLAEGNSWSGRSDHLIQFRAGSACEPNESSSRPSQPEASLAKYCEPESLGTAWQLAARTASPFPFTSFLLMHRTVVLRI